MFPAGAAGEFFLHGQFLYWLLFWYPFHPRPFCQKCRWQITAKHAYTLPMLLWMKWHYKLVHGWMVYTELAPRRQHFTWHQPCNNQRVLPVHHFRGYTRYKRIQSLIQNHMRYVRSESAREQRPALLKAMNNYYNNIFKSRGLWALFTRGGDNVVTLGYAVFRLSPPPGSLVVTMS